ncbi:hypothetical protein HKD37_06G017066 [Glycine soja]
MTMMSVSESNWATPAPFQTINQKDAPTYMNPLTSEEMDSLLAVQLVNTRISMSKQLQPLIDDISHLLNKSDWTTKLSHVKCQICIMGLKWKKYLGEQAWSTETPKGLA